MPIYMDFHQFENITIDDVKRAHIADKAVQEKYGVKYLQFWVNEDAGTVFCLTEGPSAEACEACHKEAHGNIACNLQEVEQGFFKLFMGKGLQTDRGLTLKEDGNADSANRTILVADIRGVTRIKDVKDYKDLLTSTKPKNAVVDNINKFNGKFVQYSDDDSLVGVFYSPKDAIRCAITIQSELLKLAKTHGEKSEWNVIFRLGLNHGQPLTEKDGFFETTTKCAKRLCMIAEPNHISLSANLKSLYEMEIQAINANESDPGTKVLSKPEENFINKLFEITEQNLQLTSFNVSNLSTLIGMSRPQIYRKVISLTGKSPNEFIRYVRMNKALSLIKSKERNISEIALEVGYTNPSYFTKVFNDNFGFSPSTYHSIFS